MDSLLPWYIAGPAIGLTVPLILIFREKTPGFSSSFRWWSSYIAPRLNYLNYNRSLDFWQIELAIGVILAAIVLNQFGIVPDVHIADTEAYTNMHLAGIIVGGALIGFGSRLAGGCTAGHCISGTSQLSASSFIATAAFFVGGWFASTFIVELLFQ